MRWKVKRKKCIAAGMDGYISKPVALEALQKVFNDFLPPIERVAMDPAQVEKMRMNKENQTEYGDDDGERPAVDLSVLGSLCQGDDSFLISMLEDFVSINAVVMSDLDKCINTQDIENAGLHAHKLKGSAGTAGVKRLAEIAKFIEKSSKDGDWDGVFENYPLLKSEFDRARSEIAGMETT